MQECSAEKLQAAMRNGKPLFSFGTENDKLGFPLHKHLK